MQILIFMVRSIDTVEDIVSCELRKSCLRDTEKHSWLKSIELFYTYNESTYLSNEPQAYVFCSFVLSMD